MTIRYIGLDFESSGSNPWGQHVPIQLGMHYVQVPEGGSDSFMSLIGKWQWGSNYNDPTSPFYEWNEEAFGVHGIRKEDLASAPPVWVVDILAATWIIQTVGYTNRMNVIPVGWNVGGFDRQFITRWMPNLSRVLSYRTLDLNTLVFNLAGYDEKAYNLYKGAAKRYADDKLGGGALRHDALFDAKAALHEMDWLRAPQQVPA